MVAAPDAAQMPGGNYFRPLEILIRGKNNA
jgi:hypothetical protein